VLVNQEPAAYEIADGYVRAWLSTPPQATTEIHVIYRQNRETTIAPYSFRTVMQVAARRYLSEFRDNYVARNAFLYQSAYRLKHLVK
jgi:hypothetical protein